VVNKESTNLSFTIRGSFPQTNAVPSTNQFFDPVISLTRTNICFAWDAVVGTDYRIEGKRGLAETNWTTLYGPVTATSTSLNFCTNFPTEFSLFRGVRNPTLTPPPPSTNQTIINPALVISMDSICLTWDSTVGSRYSVQAKQSVIDTAWTNLVQAITATNTTSTYCVARPTPYLFFQILEDSSSTTTPPPPVTCAFIDPGLAFGTNGLCLSWASQSGTQYDLQAKRTLTEVAWTNVASVTATGALTIHCLPKTTPYAFFQVAPRTGSGASGSTNGVALRTPAVLADGRLSLAWDAEAGATYEVQVTTNLLPVIRWTTLTNLTPAGAAVTVTDSSSVTNGVMRFYRVLKR
jgi:hypothetical protein